MLQLETFYQRGEVDVVSILPHSTLVGHFGEHMRVVNALLLFLQFSYEQNSLSLHLIFFFQYGFAEFL